MCSQPALTGNMTLQCAAAPVCAQLHLIEVLLTHTHTHAHTHTHTQSHTNYLRACECGRQQWWLPSVVADLQEVAGGLGAVIKRVRGTEHEVEDLKRVVTLPTSQTALPASALSGESGEGWGALNRGV